MDPGDCRCPLAYWLVLHLMGSDSHLRQTQEQL